MNWKSIKMRLYVSVLLYSTFLLSLSAHAIDCRYVTADSDTVKVTCGTVGQAAVIECDQTFPAGTRIQSVSLNGNAIPISSGDKVQDGKIYLVKPIAQVSPPGDNLLTIQLSSPALQSISIPFFVDYIGPAISYDPVGRKIVIMDSHSDLREMVVYALNKGQMTRVSIDSIATLDRRTAGVKYESRSLVARLPEGVVIIASDAKGNATTQAFSFVDLKHSRVLDVFRRYQEREYQESLAKMLAGSSEDSSGQDEKSFKLAVLYINNYGMNTAGLTRQFSKIKKIIDDAISLYDQQFKINQIHLPGFREGSIAKVAYFNQQLRPGGGAFGVQPVQFAGANGTGLSFGSTIDLATEEILPFGTEVSIGGGNSELAEYYARDIIGNVQGMGSEELLSDWRKMNVEALDRLFKVADVDKGWNKSRQGARLLVFVDQTAATENHSYDNILGKTFVDGIFPIIIVPFNHLKDGHLGQLSDEEMPIMVAHELGHSYGLAHIAYRHTVGEITPLPHGIPPGADKSWNVMLSSVSGEPSVWKPFFTLPQMKRVVIANFGEPRQLAAPAPSLFFELGANPSGLEQYSCRELMGIHQRIEPDYPFSPNSTEPVTPNTDEYEFPWGVGPSPVGKFFRNWTSFKCYPKIAASPLEREFKYLRPASIYSTNTRLGQYEVFMPGEIDSRTGQLDNEPVENVDTWRIAQGVDRLEVGLIPMSVGHFANSFFRSYEWESGPGLSGRDAQGTALLSWAQDAGALSNRVEIPIPSVGDRRLSVTQYRQQDDFTVISIQILLDGKLCTIGQCNYTFVAHRNLLEDTRSAAEWHSMALVLKRDQVEAVSGNFYIKQ